MSRIPTLYNISGAAVFGALAVNAIFTGTEGQGPAAAATGMFVFFAGNACRCIVREFAREIATVCAKSDSAYQLDTVSPRRAGSLHPTAPRAEPPPQT
jgi:hypothetical protein